MRLKERAKEAASKVTTLWRTNLEQLYVDGATDMNERCIEEALAVIRSNGGDKTVRDRVEKALLELLI